MNLLQKIEQAEVARLVEGRAIPEFSPGDTLRVNVKVVEGTRERVQAYEGVCIARKNAGVNSSFTVRKISYGEGVERVCGEVRERSATLERRRASNDAAEVDGVAPLVHGESAPQA